MTSLDIGLISYAMLITAVAVGQHLKIRRVMDENDHALATIMRLAVHVDPSEAVAAGTRQTVIDALGRAQQ